MFELNSIRELNHRLSRLMDLSGQRQHAGNIAYSPTVDQATEYALESQRRASYGFPTHMNLEIAGNKSSATPNASIQQNALLLQRQVQRLKEQNRQLTHEVGQKSNLVTALEQEKRTLIKQVFQRSNSHAPNSLNQQPQTNNKGSRTGQDDKKQTSQSLSNILMPSQIGNRKFDAAKTSSRNTFVGRGPAIFKSASSLYQQQDF